MHHVHDFRYDSGKGLTHDSLSNIINCLCKGLINQFRMSIMNDVKNKNET